MLVCVGGGGEGGYQVWRALLTLYGLLWHLRNHVAFTGISSSSSSVAWKILNDPQCVTCWRDYGLLVQFVSSCVAVTGMRSSSGRSQCCQLLVWGC